MDRMSFIPGPKAKAEIHEAEGRIFFNRAAALDYADEFIWNAPGGGLARSPHIRFLYPLVSACLSEGDLVDVWFGLRSPERQEQDDGGENHGGGGGGSSERVYATGEDIGHTWAVLTHAADGRKQTLWEVGRDTPFPSEDYARRAFNAYRQMLAEYTGTGPPAPMIQVTQEKEDKSHQPQHQLDQQENGVGGGGDAADSGGAAKQGENRNEAWPTRFRDKPVASRALAPANLYHASARMWYFVDFAQPGHMDEEPVLSRPVRAFDALILSTLITLAYGTPPLVFGVRYRLENIGKMPAGYLRTQYEANEVLREQTLEEVLLVM